MPVHTWKYVYTHCPTCNMLRRVIVTYPTWNGPFRPTTYECDCGTVFKVSDPHKYDQDGYIIEGGPHTKCNVNIVHTAANP